MHLLYPSEELLSQACFYPHKKHIDPHVYLLKDYFALTDAQLRSKVEISRGCYIAESLKLLDMALELGHSPHSILSSERWIEELRILERRYPDLLKECITFIASESQLKTLTGYHVHRGTLASLQRPPLLSTEELIYSGSLLVVLEDLVDHSNLGAICRSVVGLGAGGLILSPRCADPLYRRSLRVSMGAALRVPWARNTQDWKYLANQLHHGGYEIVALSIGADQISLRTLAQDAPKRIALLLGSEGHGLSQEALAQADHHVYIEMQHGVESLNVASAASIAMWALASFRKNQ